MTQKAPPHKFATAERRQIAIAMRREGATYDQIGSRLGISTTAAYNHVTKALESIQKAIENDADLYRALEADRLDALQAAIWPQAAGEGDLKAIDRVLRVMERRAKLLGLDAPAKVAATTADGEYAATSGVIVVPSVAGNISEWMKEVDAYKEEKEKSYTAISHNPPIQ